MVRVGIVVGSGLVVAAVFALLGLLNWWQAAIAGFVFGSLFVWWATDEVDDDDLW